MLKLVLGLAPAICYNGFEAGYGGCGSGTYNNGGSGNYNNGGRGNFNGGGRGGGGGGYRSGNASNNGAGPSNNPKVCFCCKQPGHTVQDCPRFQELMEMGDHIDKKRKENGGGSN